jgi:hypothetical protein
MLQERDFEDVISKYPELIEDGLILKGRQVTVYGRRIDLLFEDKFRKKLIVELKKGPIKDEHIGQIMSYEGILLSADDPTIRVMLVGNRVPPNIRKALDHHGIAWREITFNYLKDFLTEKDDEEFPSLMEDSIDKPYYEKKSRAASIYLSGDALVSLIKTSEVYENFKAVIPEKERNEDNARKILIENLGNISFSHLKEIISLIDTPYQYLHNGKFPNSPWFGRLLRSNTSELFGSDIYRVNNWFNILTNGYFSLEKKFSLLLNEPNSISGLNVGFITLMLYLLDKSNYCVWFEGLHNGFRKFFPENEKYSGKIDQYVKFNTAAKEFASKQGFTHTELDWIFSTGINIADDETSHPATIIKVMPSSQPQELFGINLNDQEENLVKHIFLSHNMTPESFSKYLAEKFITDSQQREIFVSKGVWLKVRLNYVAALLLTKSGKEVFTPKDIREMVMYKLIPSSHKMSDSSLSGTILTQDVHDKAKIEYNNGYPCLSKVGHGQYKFIGFRNNLIRKP